MRSACTVISVLLLLAGSILPLADRASACASVGRRGPVRIHGEEALIVWDPEHQKQHFVRVAGFEPADEDFGFLVPTPTRPELAEADDAVFERLFAIYRRPPPQSALRSRGGGPRSAPAHVQVLERRSVAGLDAAVLRANDAGALTRWLGQHGYPSSEPLQRWLAPYVAQRWIVSAFRIDPAAHRGSGFSTRALRMSFDTDAPFFPYSEPVDASARAPGRPFRVSVVAPTRMRVRAGNDAWHGRVGYAGQPAERLGTALRGVVPDGSFGAGAWLTVFDEPSSVRGAADLYFERDPSQRSQAPSIDAALVPHAANIPTPL
jgi:hypothetical protein